MIRVKKSCAFLVPLVLGLYCLIQGTVLALKNDLLLQPVGICVLLWVPGCVYYTWRGYNALFRRALKVVPAPARENRFSSVCAEKGR